MSSTSDISMAEALDIVSSDKEYEVFLSFRGPDIRAGFTDHLYRRLIDANVSVYRDDEELRKGEKIESELLQAIKGSAIAIPIFSKKYAESKWCLNELVEITECKRSRAMKVMPIFYYVKPSDVRNQTGDYEEAFEKYEQKYGISSTLIRKWKKAMSEIGKLSGWEIPSDTYSGEGKLVEDITKEISFALKKAHVEIPDYLVGLDYHVGKILEMLSLETQGVRIIGIHGMGGIGKTTLAKVVYNCFHEKFEGSSFLADTRSKDIWDLKKNMTSEILARKSSTYVDKETSTKRFIDKKVLIVIDDADEETRIEDLIGKREKRLFASGSRIIITSRDTGFFTRIPVNEPYELTEMERDHSLQLFCKHAFESDEPQSDYVILSNEIVGTTGGLPLSLEVIGSSLYNKSKEDWKNKLEILKGVPADHVMKKLRTSYDDLNDRQKHLFLDIACFFIGDDQREVIHFWDPRKFYPKEAIKVLQQKSLIKVRNNELWMHDQLRDLGREIVREGNIMNPEKQTRLWNQEEGTEVFMTKTGTEHIQGIRVNEEVLNNMASLNEALAKFSNVRLFWATSFRFPLLWSLDCLDLPSNFLPENPPPNYLNEPSNSLLENPRVFSELRWLYWECFPHDRIETSNFSLLNLTILKLSGSDFTIEWEGWSQIKMAKNLKVLDLSFCKKLVRTPDFSSHLQLEQLILSECSALVEIDESIGKLELLFHLDLSACKKLSKLPKKLADMKSLIALNLFGCAGIVEIPQLTNKVKLEVFDAACSGLEGCISLNNLTSLKQLNLGETKISFIPDSIGKLVHLVKLYLNGCSSLEKLPECIEGLVSLTYLDLSESSIEELPNSIGNLKNLIELHISCSLITELPSTIEMAKKLEKIHAGGCRFLCGGVPMLPESLIDLSLPVRIMDSVPNLSNQINLVNFRLDIDDGDDECPPIEWASRDWAPIESPSPEWIGNLSKAKRLDLAFPQFTTLHPDLGSLSQLTHLRLVGCIHLQNIPKLPSELTSLEFDHCYKMSKVDELPENLQKLVISNCKNLTSLLLMSQYKKLEHFYLSECPNVLKIHGRLESLVKLRISNCENLRRLPQMSQYKKLEHFYLSECPNVVGIYGILESLKQLEISNCKNLRSLPQMSQYKKLKRFCLSECPNVVEIQGILESLKQLKISNCKKLRRLPQMSQCKKLEDFSLGGCPKVVEIHGRLESLKDLSIWSCGSLVKIPYILNVKTLASFYIEDCPKLFHESRITRRKPILTDNPPKSEDERSFMSNMVRICSCSQNEEVKGKGKRKR